jgi:hypothetical protein
LQPTWFILGRRSYLSLSQLGGVVFSEALSEEARIRAAALNPVFPAGSWFYERDSISRTSESISLAQLEAICRAPGVAFFVSNVPLVRDVLPAEWPTKSMYVYLHDCRRFVSGRS